MRAVSFVFCLLVVFPTSGATLAHGTEERADLDLRVELDPDEQTGRATATIRIHASRPTVWPVVTTCAEALKTVPGLVACTVVASAADGSWQRLRHVVDYSWITPRLTYEIRAAYDKPSRVTIERVAGDLKTLRVDWSLQSDGEDTIARYAVDLAPGFWVPRWLVRSALKRDLPKMLRAVRSEAEAAGKSP